VSSDELTDCVIDRKMSRTSTSSDDVTQRDDDEQVLFIITDKYVHCVSKKGPNFETV